VVRPPGELGQRAYLADGKRAAVMVLCLLMVLCVVETARVVIEDNRSCPSAAHASCCFRSGVASQSRIARNCQREHSRRGADAKLLGSVAYEALLVAFGRGLHGFTMCSLDKGTRGQATKIASIDCQGPETCSICC
jgi:hypothetical protein